MDQDLKLRRRLVGARNDAERFMEITNELDRLGYGESISYLRATAGRLFDAGWDIPTVDGLEIENEVLQNRVSELEGEVDELQEEIDELTDELKRRPEARDVG